MNKCTLKPIAFGLALGILSGLSLLIIGLLNQYMAYGKPMVQAFDAVYMGYEPNFISSIIGGIMGFIDSFIAGFLIAWLYNCFAGSCECCTTEVVPVKTVKTPRAKAATTK